MSRALRLNQLLHEYGLVVPIQRAVRERGVPYVGWSAGCGPGWWMWPCRWM